MRDQRLLGTLNTVESVPSRANIGSGRHLVRGFTVLVDEEAGLNYADSPQVFGLGALSPTARLKQVFWDCKNDALGELNIQ